MKHLIPRFTAALLAVCMIPAGTAQEPSLVNSNGTQIDTDAERLAFRAALGTTNPLRVGFYDNFADPVRHPNGTRLAHKVTQPLYGDPWYWASNDLEAPYVFNGALRILRRGGGYIAAHASPEDITDFSYFFEFWREVTGTAAAPPPSYAVGGLTITVGSGNLVQEDGSTHNAPGNIHVNTGENGITQMGLFASSITVSSATGGTDAFATATPHNFATGDFLSLSGAGLATAGVTAGEYHAIVTGASTFQIAATRVLAVAGTAVDVAADSAGVMAVERAFECINRTYRSGAFPWLPPSNTSLYFQGSTSDTLTTEGPHGFFPGDPVLLAGGGLPTASGGNLAEKTVYYVAAAPAANTLTLARTSGGAVIDLTSNGSANQTLHGPRTDASAASMPSNRKSCMVVSIKGDYLTFSLVGVGDIIFYWRDLNAIFSGASTANGKTVGFYYQSTQPEAPGGVFYSSTFPLVAAGIDAPELLRQTLMEHAGYVATLAGSARHKLPGQLNLTQDRQGHYGTAIHQNLTPADYPLFVGGSGLTSLGNNLFRIKGGNPFVEGNYVSQQGFSVGSLSQVGIAPASINASQDAATSIATTGVEATLKNLETVMTLQTGDMETLVITGQLSGAATQSIRIAHYNGTLLTPTIFNSNLTGNPLNAVAKSFEIILRRKQESANTHVTSTTLIVDGVVIGPQRQTANMSMNYHYYSILVTQSAASAVTIDSILQTVHRVKRG